MKIKVELPPHKLRKQEQLKLKSFPLIIDFVEDEESEVFFVE